MIVDKNRIFDGWVSLEGGVDAGRAGGDIDANQCVSAENMTFRGGHATTRPGFRKLTESFTNPNHCYDLKGNNTTTNVPGQEAHTIYRKGRFQCALGYAPHSGNDCIMALIGGRLYQITPRVRDAVVSEVVFPYRNRDNLPIGYMLQAEKWFIVQDGESPAMLLNDSDPPRRASVTETEREKTEIPVGTIMAYGMGRVVVVVSNGRHIAFGDIFGSHLDKPDPADALIMFTERNFISEGFDAAIPFHQGIATGAVFFPQLDTSTGNGQLLVFSERGANSFFLSLPREQWKTSQFQILALLTTGLRGHRSIAVANEDIWFRAEDGVRSYRQARSEQYGWAHIPQSTNVRQFLENDSTRMLEFISSIYFDNRVLMLTSPYPNHATQDPWATTHFRPHHQGMVVVDFDILSSFGDRPKPAWDGHWTFPQGISIFQVLTASIKGVTRAFAFGVDQLGNNQLYEITMEDKDDWDNQLIQWELVTRKFDFQKLNQGGSPFGENELYDADLWLRDIIE